MTATVPLEGLQGVQEMTFTVADLDQASQFFRTFFGAQVVAESGSQGDSHRSTMRAFANADVRAVIHRSQTLRTPFLNLRLLEASYPGQRVIWPGMLDVGGWHLAGYVDDMDAAMDYLAGTDVYVLGPGKKPTTNAPEVGEGSYACHCMTSWGFHFELLTYPNGRAYMADFDNRLWNPAEPDAGATPRTAQRAGLPGFRGFEHLSVGVSDVDEASALLEQLLGCERFYDMGPMDDRHGSGFGAYANVDVRIAVSRVRLLRTRFLNLELIEPRYPGQHRTWPGLLDVGGWQLAFAVDDVERAAQALSDADVHLLGGPRKEVAEQSGADSVRQSCLTQFGLHLDFVQSEPNGDSGAWHPARPEL